jgi:hypothetical protein
MKWKVGLTCLIVAACGDGNSYDRNNGSISVKVNPVTLSENADKVSGPDCGAAQPVKDRRNIQGIVPGMTPAQAGAILVCQGAYVQTDFYGRKSDSDGEAKDFTYAMWNYAKQDKRDFIRVFAEGPPNDRRIYYIGRAVFFDRDPPTMQAVYDQFKIHYDPATTNRTKFGGIVAHRFNDASGQLMANDSEYVSACSGLAYSHDPGERFTAAAIMNPTPYGNPNCGESISLELIQNGTNDNLAYVATYRLANPSIAAAYSQKRIAVEQEAERARVSRETLEAGNTSRLPDL